jgi:hypothetical protein
MSSDAQIAANQSNAQFSTGPRTEAGKRNSSQNNFRHGLASGQILIPGEDPAEFEALRAAFFAEHKPATATQIALVNGLAQHHWFTRRAMRLQNEHITDDRKLALYLRYQTTHERAFHKCLADLLKLRKQMTQELIGFESQKQKKALNEAKIRSLDARPKARKGADPIQIYDETKLA